MANVTIYLNNEVEKRVRQAARRAKKPLSRWLADLAEASVTDKWPTEFLALAGSLPDLPEPEPMSFGPDTAREPFPK